MKRYIFLISLMLLLGLSFSIVAVDFQGGYEAQLNFNPQLELDLMAGCVDGADCWDYLVRANLFYQLQDEDLSGHAYLLTEGTSKYRRVIWGFDVPFNEQGQLSAGVRWEKPQGEKSLENILLRGDWEVGDGLISLGGELGSGPETINLQYLHRLESQLTKKVFVSTDLGLKYSVSGEEQELIIPTNLLVSYHLNDSLELQAKAKHSYMLFSGENELSLSLILSQAFDFYEEDYSIAEGSETEIAPRKIVDLLTEESQAIEVAKVEMENAPVKEEKVETIQVVDTTSKQPIKSNQDRDEAPRVLEQSELEMEGKLPKPHYDRESGSLYWLDQQVTIESFSIEDECYLPIREVVEALGGQVFWDQDSEQIYLVYRNKRMLIDVGSEELLFNGTMRTINGELQFKDGHYYLQAEQLLNLLG